MDDNVANNFSFREKIAQFQSGSSEESKSEDPCGEKLLNRNSKELEITNNKDVRDKSAAAC